MTTKIANWTPYEQTKMVLRYFDFAKIFGVGVVSDYVDADSIFFKDKKQQQVI